jgi:SAM-dependent methyltransferase
MIDTQIYRHCFSEREIYRQRAFWCPICNYLQRYVHPDGVTLDLGAGFCHFINNIRAREKIALDVNEENLRRYADKGVRIIAASGSDLSMIPSASVDTVFASNVYEHFQSREQVATSFAEVHRILRQGASFIILQPNFAYCWQHYFDFFDHRLIFTHIGMVEGLLTCGFEIVEVIARFLPFTSKSRLPTAPWLGLALSAPASHLARPGRADAHRCAEELNSWRGSQE